jgi:hypothetical protein
MYTKSLKCMVLACVILFSISFLSIAEENENPKSFSIGIEAGYFAAEDEDLTDLYGSGNLIFGVNAGYKIANNWELVSGINFFSDEGATTLTEETIELSLTHLRFGGFYHFNTEGLDPIVGAGIDICWVSEKNPIEDFDDTGIGWFAGIGVETSISADFKAAVNLLYSNSKVEGDLGDISLGGFSFLVNLKMLLF